MKQMQDFHDEVFSNETPDSPLERRLRALTRLERERLPFLAALEPWFIWSAGAPPAKS